MRKPRSTGILLVCCGALFIGCGKSQPAPQDAPTSATSPTSPIEPAKDAVATAPAEDGAAALMADASVPVAPDAATVGVDAPVGTEDGASGPDDAALVDAGPAPVVAGADSPAAALQLYYEGTREKNADKLWAIMSEPAKAALSGVRNSALQATDEQLRASGLVREKLKDMSDREFFVAMVATTPLPSDMSDMKPPADLRSESTGDGRTKLRFKLAEAFCEADLVKEADGWKVDGTQCEEGG